MVAHLVQDGDPDLLGELLRVGEGRLERPPENRHLRREEFVLLVEPEQPGLVRVVLPDNDRKVPEGRKEGGRQLVEGPANGLVERRQAPRPSRIRSATEAISSVAPLTSFRIASALGPWPSDQSSRSSPPASRLANQSLPKVSRR